LNAFWQCGHLISCIGLNVNLFKMCWLGDEFNHSFF
jgi:hypothetical protein